MKSSLKFFALLFVVVVIVLVNPVNAKNNKCTRLQDGVLVYSASHYYAGAPLPLGFDDYGYNYQSHLFNGYYVNVYLGSAGYPPYLGDDDAYLSENPGAANHWAWPYRETMVTMKWNDAWLSNQNCDGDDALDRHYGFNSYIDSGAWETNHMSGTYVGEDGKKCHWTYFVKVIAVSSDSERINGIWYRPDGTEIGPSIWGQFAIIEEIENDPCVGVHGVQYLSPAAPGWGRY